MNSVTTLATLDCVTVRNHPLIASAHANGENRNTFEAFIRGFIADLEPVGAIEGTLAARAAGIAWRLNRAQGLETLVLTKPDKYDRTTALGDGLSRSSTREALDLVSRWEQGLERSLLKTLDAFDKAQAVRQRRRKSQEKIKTVEDVPIVGAMTHENESAPDGVEPLISTDQ